MKHTINNNFKDTMQLSKNLDQNWKEENQEHYSKIKEPTMKITTWNVCPNIPLNAFLIGGYSIGKKINEFK
jgi:hypothetical protein